MPWQETGMFDQRLQFVVAAERGEDAMAVLCRRFGISRTTGYLWLARYRQGQAAALADRSRAPHHRPHAVRATTREALLAQRAAHPSWGPKKLVAALQRQQPSVRWPATSTVGELLRQAGVIAPRRRRAHAPPRTQPLAHATAANVVWCADFKGDFLLGDGSRCYPLTITDAHSRYLVRCQALPTTSAARAQPVFAAAFAEYGLPDLLRTDNGGPFVGVGTVGLTTLSAWWVRLGIRPERIRRGHPEENGRHERLHRTLKAEACRPPGQTLAEQQRLFDAFRQEYNTVRPHEALAQLPPAAIYTPGTRPYPTELPPLSYPDAEAVRTVHRNGALRWRGQDVYISDALIRETVGLVPLADERWAVQYGDLEIGVLDPRTGRLEPPRARHAVQDVAG